MKNECNALFGLLFESVCCCYLCARADILIIMSNSCWCIENAVPVFNAIAYDLGGGSVVLLEEGIVLVVLLLICFYIVFISISLWFLNACSFGIHP